MPSNRRTFLTGALGVGAAAAAPKRDFASLRADFPWLESDLFFNPAGYHPMPTPVRQAMLQYLEYKVKGPAEGRGQWASGRQDEARALFARMVNATPAEIALVPSTLVGENHVVNGLGIPGGKWNVVTDELHYEGSLYLYKNLQKAGLDLRIVKMKDWRVDPKDMERVVDRNTRLIAYSLVSCANGALADAKNIGRLAHAHGAYTYADIVQAVGAVPVDVKAMEIDFCAASGYKWLMGDRGLGYFYVKAGLLDRVLKQNQWGDRQFSDFQYHIFPYDPPGEYPATWSRNPGAAGRFEVGQIANAVAAGQAAGMQYIFDLGIDRIQAHVRPMCEKLRRELPRLGYPCMTRMEEQTPTQSFVVAKPDVTRSRLAKAGITAKFQWNQTRISCSVYHSMADVDRLLNALS